MEVEHYIQLEILRQLLFKSEARFSELNPEEITNDHFTFHLKKLLNRGFIEKDGEMYKLTAKGMELAGRLNAENAQIIKQPKVSISIGVFRKNIDGKDEILISRRKRDQSKGKIAWITEKVRIGESLKDTCLRGLEKDTGLKADFEFAGVFHIIRNYKEGLEIDAVIICFKALNISGDLKVESEESLNEWIPIEDALGISDEQKVIGFNGSVKDYLNSKIFYKEYITHD